MMVEEAKQEEDEVEEEDHVSLIRRDLRIMRALFHRAAPEAAEQETSSSFFPFPPCLAPPPPLPSLPRSHPLSGTWVRKYCRKHSHSLKKTLFAESRSGRTAGRETPFTNRQFPRLGFGAYCTCSYIDTIWSLARCEHFLFCRFP
ncbi:hypothetical protein FKM82_007454 [Ascaphus truei]